MFARLRTNLSHFILCNYLSLPYSSKNNFNQSSAASLTLTENDSLVIQTIKPVGLALSSLLVSVGIILYLFIVYPFETFFVVSVAA